MSDDINGPWRHFSRYKYIKKIIKVGTNGPWQHFSRYKYINFSRDKYIKQIDTNHSPRNLRFSEMMKEIDESFIGNDPNFFENTENDPNFVEKNSNLPIKSLNEKPLSINLLQKEIRKREQLVQTYIVLFGLLMSYATKSEIHKNVMSFF